jgi:hypothetical protein
MRIVVFYAGTAPRVNFPPRCRCGIEALPLDQLPAYTPLPDDIAYLCCSGTEPASLRKSINRLKAKCADTPWGIIDEEGSIADPAALFHQGAADYIGPTLLAAENLEPARFKRVRDCLARSKAPAQADNATGDAGQPETRAAIEDAVGFPGWHKLKPGETRTFHFLYAGPAEATALKVKMGEQRYSALRELIKAHLLHAFSPADAIIWMQTDTYFLFLFPPDEARARAATEACIRILLNLSLLSAESFGLETSLQLVFALHRGKTPYQVPGQTGTVVSEDINFIHHLGMKKAEAGRLSVTANAISAVHPALEDLFVDAGEFEGKKFRRSLRFL